MDLTKAYDCIPYDFLLAKLQACGTDEKSLDLLQSYLFGRKQRVKLNSEYSSYVTINRGINFGSFTIQHIYKRRRILYILQTITPYIKVIKT